MSSLSHVLGEKEESEEEDDEEEEEVLVKEDEEEKLKKKRIEKKRRLKERFDLEYDDGDATYFDDLKEEMQKQAEVRGQRLMLPSVRFR